MTRRRTTAVILCAALGAVWMSAGIAPFRDAVGGAVAPSDFATDFVPAERIRRGARPHVDTAWGNAEAARLGAPRYADIGVPFGAHPPPSVALVAALVPLGFKIAAEVWLAIAVLSLAMVAWVATGALGMGGRRRLTASTLLLIALAAWPPVLHNLEKGQWSVLLAGLLAGAWWASARGRHALAGGLLAVAAGFKVVPVLALAGLVRRAPSARRRLLAGAVIAGAAVAIAATVAAGPAAWLDFFRSAPENTRGWQTGPANTLSLWGLLSRLLIGGPFARPLSTAPGTPLLAPIAWALGATALVALALRSGGPSVRHGTDGGRHEDYDEDYDEDHDGAALGLRFAIWSVLVVVLSPLSWTHAAAMLVVPLALVARHLRRGRLLLFAALALLTVPRATLFRLAGAFPVAPARGLALAAHLAAALLLFLLAVLAARGARAARATTTTTTTTSTGPTPPARAHDDGIT